MIEDFSHCPHRNRHVTKISKPAILEYTGIVCTLPNAEGKLRGINTMSSFERRLDQA